jgi:hypothetical protein
MQSKPTIDQTYRRDYDKGKVEDSASIESLTKSVTLPIGSYQNVLVTKEWSVRVWCPYFL